MPVKDIEKASPEQLKKADTLKAWFEIMIRVGKDNLCLRDYAGNLSGSTANSSARYCSASVRSN
jgi:hypothetical protein